jgi:hypothetical protein
MKPTSPKFAANEIVPVFNQRRRNIFASYCDTSGGLNACWPWMGSKNAKGYGTFAAGHNTNLLAHRVSFAIANGRTPKRQMVCHSCDNPACVNPAHLWLGNHQTNADDMVSKGRAPRPLGERHHSAKLTPAKVRRIRARYAAGGVTTIKLGAEYGVSHQVIHRIISRKIWKHI